MSLVTPVNSMFAFCRACGNRHVARGARASSDVAREFRALFKEPARKSEWVSGGVFLCDLICFLEVQQVTMSTAR